MTKKTITKKKDTSQKFRTMKVSLTGTGKGLIMYKFSPPKIIG